MCVCARAQESQLLSNDLSDNDAMKMQYAMWKEICNVLSHHSNSMWGVLLLQKCRPFSNGFFPPCKPQRRVDCLRSWINTLCEGNCCPRPHSAIWETKIRKLTFNIGPRQKQAEDITVPWLSINCKEIPPLSQAFYTYIKYCQEYSLQAHDVAYNMPAHNPMTSLEMGPEWLF